MPQTSSAKKALRVSRRRRQINLASIKKYKGATKAAKSAKDLALAQKALDKASKSGVIHKNKAARLKSRLAKKLTSKKSTTEVATVRRAKTKVRGKGKKAKTKPRKK